MNPSREQTQSKQEEWHEQWSLFRDEEKFLFEEWIAPLKLEDFRNKAVLECGCGGGQHTSFVAPYAASVTAVDLNTADLARERNRTSPGVRFIEADIASLNLPEQFDIVFCIGVIHHTDDPDKTFASLYRHCKPGGKIAVWTYSAEGNGLVRYLVEPARKLLLRRMPRRALLLLSKVITVLLYPFVYTVYLLPFLSFLPYYEYFKNFRRLTFTRNTLNVFDKLNAPQTRFTTLEKCHEWFDPSLFEADSVSIRKYAGVSYSLVGTKKR